MSNMSSVSSVKLMSSLYVCQTAVNMLSVIHVCQIDVRCVIRQLCEATINMSALSCMSCPACLVNRAMRVAGVAPEEGVGGIHQVLSAHQAAVIPGAAPVASAAADQRLPGVPGPAAASARPRAVLLPASGQ